MIRTNSKRSRILTGLTTVLILNIAGAAYLANLYKFTICISDATCTSDIYRGLAIPIFPIGIMIGFSTLDGDSKK